MILLFLGFLVKKTLIFFKTIINFKKGDNKLYVWGAFDFETIFLKPNLIKTWEEYISTKMDYTKVRLSMLTKSPRRRNHLIIQKLKEKIHYKNIFCCQRKNFAVFLFSFKLTFINRSLILV